MGSKKQRIRDPIHDLIVFDMGSGETPELDQALWNLVQTAPFQRLRRIKQLGFSELVFPGATHTRFAHSLGVMHIAKKLMAVIKKQWNEKEGGVYQQTIAEEAIIAALLHDLGHGPFSHTFESVCKGIPSIMSAIKPKGGIHEAITLWLIVEHPEIKAALGNYSPEKIARHIEVPDTIYGAVVSGQFDADRLDYMQRDRLMTGLQGNAIDFSWLIDNLTIVPLEVGTDETSGKKIETLALNPKARYAAENYVMSLFQLYPTVYYHKTTRAAEVMLRALLKNLFIQVQNNNLCGLSADNSLIKFMKNPFGDGLENYLALDDAVIWGSLYPLKEGGFSAVSDLAERLLERKLYKSHDAMIEFRQKVIQEFPREPDPIDEIKIEKERHTLIGRAQKKLLQKIEEKLSQDATLKNMILIDEDKRSPYKNDKTGNGLIYIDSYGDGKSVENFGRFSSVVGIAPEYHLLRVYVPDLKDKNGKFVKKAIKESMLEAIEESE